MGARRTNNPTSVGYMTGQFLVAMPGMGDPRVGDPRFDRTVIYMCAHSAEGAMGLIVNKPLNDLRFRDILKQLDIVPNVGCGDIYIHRGGPVETARGFVLHSSDYQREGTLVVNEDVALSATTEVLKAIANGQGPSHSLMALGYSGWGRGQLDDEIKRNAWLNVPADTDLLFSNACDTKWERALGKLGISAATLSGAAGHA